MSSLVELEPAFEHLLRDVGLQEETMRALRHCRIVDRETFTGLADAPEELRSIATDLAINLGDGACHTNASFRRFSWLGNGQRFKSNSRRAPKLSRGSTANQSGCCRRTGHPRSSSSNQSTVRACRKRSSQEKLAAGMLQAEPLDRIISQAEAEDQDRQKPDPPRQYGLHLNATLTIQTRRRYASSMPRNLEELRQKYDVLSNCWLLGQQRQPGRALYSDVDATTFPRIPKELLGKKNFALSKELDGKPLVAPPWSHCLSYELELR